MLFICRTFLAATLAIFLSAPAFSQKKPDFSRMVVVSDSLGAGFMNFSLSADQQTRSFANIVATQARTTLAMPLIAEPGIPAKLKLNTQPPPIVVPMDGTSTGRIDPSLQATNLSVPGHTVADALFRKPSMPIVNPSDQVQTLTNLVLGLPGLLVNESLSQVEWVERFAANPATRPTMILAWVGANDALFSILIGNPTAVTPPEVFASLYGQLIDRLSATGATVVTANIPDVTALPYITAASAVVKPASILTRIPASNIYAALGISAGDYMLPSAVERVVLMALSRNFEPLGALCPASLPGLPGPVGCVLHASDVASIQTIIRAYNAAIDAKTRASQVVLVDINALFQEIARKGIVVGGRRLTTSFLGGLFSLDGVHPTATGHAIIANEFIKTMNRKLGTDIRPVSLR